MINEDERGIFGCEWLVNVGWVGHGMSGTQTISISLPAAISPAAVTSA